MATYGSWLNSHFWRMQTSFGYFDNKLSQYQNARFYTDCYAIYKNSSLLSQHPEWVLRDQYGNMLYIPWGCSNRFCPQYAADISNPAFRSWWIQATKSILARGYKGAWMDDVNLIMNVSDGLGHQAYPIDFATGKPMTTTDWKRYMAQFMIEPRQALPTTKILHNSIWFAGTGARGSDPYVQQQIKAADWINREGGVDDGGITGDNRVWSIQELFRFFDVVHSLEAKVDLQNWNYLLYGLASYFLISGGRDALGDDATPNSWPAAYDVDLGSPNGNRYDWNGLIRRDFSKGMVLLNPKGKPTVTVKLPDIYTDTNGTIVTSVTLQAGQGGVYLDRYPSPPAGVLISDGIYVVISLLDGQAMADPASSMKAGTGMVQWYDGGYTDQKWGFTLSGNGYMIQNQQSKLYLTGTPQGGTPFQNYRTNDDTQLWSLQAVTGGYQIKNKATGYVVAIPGSTTQAGTSLIMWPALFPLYKDQIWNLR
jgi:Hypothetical glycosyl hydrolase family 15/Ricin-type beta-trefoil lectin domain-like